MRKFADLNLRPPLKDQYIQSNMANLALEIGFSLVGLRFTPKDPPIQISSAVKTFERVGLEVAVGIEVYPATRKQLLDHLRNLRSCTDILVVKCAASKVALTAAQDSRVDLISLEQATFRIKQTVLKVCESAIEIELSRVISKPLHVNSVSLKTFCREVDLLNKYKARVVVSSGARDILTMRSPRDMAHTLESFGLLREVSLDAVSRVPYLIFRKNREKLSAKFIGTGITLVRSRDK
ncbi:MAG: RNase P subunit p30 family protein [Candidatus Bathyarchaeia archaeon]